VWLAGIAVYQLVTRSRGIRIIPASLCVGGLVTFAGPWGAYEVSERSQVHRLAGLLEANTMLVDGQAKPATGEVSEDDRREIEAALTYLAGTHGLGAVAPWFPESVRAASGALSDPKPAERPTEVARRILRDLAIAPAPAVRPDGAFRFTARPAAEPIAVGDFDVLLRVGRWTRGAPSGIGWSIRGDSAEAALIVYLDREPVASFPLEPLVMELHAGGASRRTVAPDELSVLSAERRAALYLRILGGRLQEGQVVVTAVAGEILVRDQGQ
jgi:hypothetical protein